VRVEISGPLQTALGPYTTHLHNTRHCTSTTTPPPRPHDRPPRSNQRRPPSRQQRHHPLRAPHDIHQLAPHEHGLTIAHRPEQWAPRRATGNHRPVPVRPRCSTGEVLEVVPLRGRRIITNSWAAPTSVRDACLRPGHRARSVHCAVRAADRRVGTHGRADNVPGTTDSTRTQWSPPAILDSAPIHITPAHTMSSQVTTPLTTSARRNFQADDVGSIPVVRSTRNPGQG
jgi:hypothetical protein